MIALLCPTRGRPEQFKRMANSIRRTSSKVIVHCHVEGEDSLYNSSNMFGVLQVIFPVNGITVFRWNLLAQEAMKDPANKLFMLCADDIIFSTPGWDKALIDHYNALENKIHVYALQDSRDKDGTPHPIVTREYIEAMGYFLPPVFLHWYVDSWTVDIARANNCFTHLRDFSLVHDKPSDVGKPDETHLGIRRMVWHERDKYVNDTCQHFLEFEKQRLAKAIAA